MSICSSQKMRGAWITFHLFHEQATGLPKGFPSNQQSPYSSPAVRCAFAHHQLPRMGSCQWLLQYVSMLFGCRLGVEWLSAGKQNPESCRVELCQFSRDFL